MRPVLLSVLGLATILRNVDAQEPKARPESVHEFRRLNKANSHLQPIAKNPWELIDKEEEGQGVHMVELQIQPAFTSDVDELTLAKVGETQPSRLTCLPESCKEGLDGYCDNCLINYCMTNMDLMSERPNEYPNFMYVVDTEHCSAQSVQWDVNEIYEMLKAEDDAPGAQKDRTDSKCRSLPVQLGIFEMGYTDSERATKSLAAVDPANLVFTDAQPFYEALMMCKNKRKELLRTEPCSRKNVIDLFRKTAYLMCRTCDPSYEQCIIKLWADATVSMDLFEEAFPRAEMMFIYTEPNTYMGSAIDPDHVERAPCAKNKRLPSPTVKEAVEKIGRDIESMTVEEICAIEANIVMETAIQEKKKSRSFQIVHADDILEALDSMQSQRRGGVGYTPAEKKAMSSVAAKDRSGVADPKRYENMKKEAKKRVTDKMAAASAEFIEGPFKALENLSGFGKK